MIDLRPMKAVEIDADRRRARVQAGVTWRELDAATQAEGLAVTGGRISSTGVAGFTLGSAASPPSRRASPARVR
jgi:FAD/FMN-containing dehydrogenase